MSELGKFYNPNEMDLNKIIDTYQVAFAGEPWYEVSKCVNDDEFKKCNGEFCQTAVGQICPECNNAPTEPAYNCDELVSKFEITADTRPTIWYTEESIDGVTLGANAWAVKSSQIASEKYSGIPEMETWLQAIIGDNEIVWLDEIFANREISPNGNLKNFKEICDGFMEKLDCSNFAFRTINPRMISAAKKCFDGQLIVFEKEINVPDWRDFVLISKFRDNK